MIEEHTEVSERAAIYRSSNELFFLLKHKGCDPLTWLMKI